MGQSHCRSEYILVFLGLYVIPYHIFLRLTGVSYVDDSITFGKRQGLMGVHLHCARTYFPSPPSSMPPRRAPKSSKVKAIKTVPNDTRESSAAPVPCPLSTGQVRHTHSRVPVSSILSNSGSCNIANCYKAKVVKDQGLQEGPSAPAPLSPPRPPTGRGQRIRSRVPVSLLYLSYVESFP